jgi:NCS1 family nucleobase:cation symporter-1
MHDPTLAREALAELPPDIADSPLFNGDLAPVPTSRRNWTTYNFAALWISMAHCIPTYTLAGGLMAKGMNWWQALLTVGLGNLIVLVPILLNAHPGTAYGISFPVLARASFGTTGANIPALLRALVACGWFGINAFVGGEAIKTFIVTFAPGFASLGAGSSLLGLSWSSAITFLIFWAMNIFILYRGMNAIRIFENWAAPIVLVLAALLLGWMCARAGGVGPLLTRPSQFESFSTFWPVFVPSLTAMIGFWSTLSLNIPDFTRFGRGQREQMVGQALGLPTTMIAFSAMAIVITSASSAVLPQVPLEQLWNPDVVLGFMTSSSPPQGMDAPLIGHAGTRALVAVVAVIGIVIATLSVNIAANVVSPAQDFANLAPRHISFQTGGLLTGLLGIACMPWKLLADPATYLGGWLGGVGGLLGPVAGIMIADYWIVRKRQLDVVDLFRPHGQYAGVNLVAVVALAAGVLPNLPGFLAGVHAIDPIQGLFAELYPYAWFSGFFVSFIVYAFVMRVRGPLPPVVTDSSMN